ncbi:MAG: HAMP domain-containing sensor histidine kinase [Eubacteriales bacterium]|nr:HAMP domain-containing sensor histidine kinase [Eubacteriales bacterium]
MYQKLHIQLTIFCCSIISIILITMTCFNLKTISDNQNLRQFNDFQKSIANIYQTLSEQDNISHAWLRTLSIDNNFLISILDNDNPIAYNLNINMRSDETVFDHARNTAWESYALSARTVKYSDYMKHIEFQMDDVGTEKYLSSVGYIPKEYGILTVIILYPITSQFSNLKTLFLPIIFIALVAILILSLCSFFLIRNLIRPLIKSHEQQVAFFAAASHELRSPVTVIMTALPLLKNPSAEKQKTSYALIEKECFRMKRLINDMFTLASLTNGAISIHKRNTYINNLLIDSYEKFESIAAQKKIHINFLLPDVLIPEITCDPDRISQVFTILLDNAISYTPQGGTIQVFLLLQSNHILISVADNGPGIPDEYKDKIFQRFYRCDNSRTDKNHFGLGLSIAKEIIELHNGTISAVNSKIGGAEFVVKLPLNK